MSERITIRARGAEPHQVQHIVGVLIRGGLIAYPTDSGYALGWRATSRQARDRVIQLRQLDRHHHFTYCCRSLADVGSLTRVGAYQQRIIRGLTPGPYTFVLPATRRVPRAVRRRRRPTVGIRIPDHVFVQTLLETLDEPLLSSSLLLPDSDEDIVDSEDLFDEVHGEVDLFVDAGYCALEPTTLLDLTGDRPVVLRQGAGVIDFL